MTTPDYYDLDAILAEQQGNNASQTLPCTALMDLAGLGFLQHNDQNGLALEAGSKVDLPFWLCTKLVFDPEGGVFTADMPKMFGSRVQAAVTADARVINLHELCPHFFVFGKTLARHVSEEALTSLLTQAFSERLQMVVDAASNSGNQDVSEKLLKLDVTERELFAIGLEVAKQFQEWKDRNAALLKPEAASVPVSGSRKRSLNEG